MNAIPEKIVEVINPGALTVSDLVVTVDGDRYQIEMEYGSTWNIRDTKTGQRIVAKRRPTEYSSRARRWTTPANAQKAADKMNREERAS